MKAKVSNIRQAIEISKTQLRLQPMNWVAVCEIWLSRSLDRVVISVVIQTTQIKSQRLPQICIKCSPWISIRSTRAITEMIYKCNSRVLKRNHQQIYLCHLITTKAMSAPCIQHEISLARWCSPIASPSREAMFRHATANLVIMRTTIVLILIAMLSAN